MRKSSVRLVVALVVVVCVVAGIVALSYYRTASVGPEVAATPSASAEETVVPTVPAPVPPATLKPEPVNGDGSKLVEPIIAAEAAARINPKKAIDFSKVAVGDALQDFQVNALEAREDGLVQVGSPTLVKATVSKVDESADPPSATVRVCLDYSSVDVQAPDGTSMKNKDAPQRVLSIMSMQQVDGRWMVARRTFPAKATC